jgi:hypothetical protein
MQARIATKININASPSEVFKYLAHLKYHHLWNPQVQSIIPIKSLALGSEYKTTSTVLGVKLTSKNIVTKFTKFKELEITNNIGLVKYEANFKLQDKTKCTIITCTTTVTSDNDAFAFAKPILKLLARRELQNDMQALKLAVEHSL